MYLLDSNIIIYSADASFDYLRTIIKDKNSYTSLISKLEVLGYHNLDEKTKIYFENVFYSLSNIDLETDIIELAINLRQKKKLSLGDSIVAATALKYNFTLLTRNISDFDWIQGIKIENPIK